MPRSTFKTTIREILDEVWRPTPAWEPERKRLGLELLRRLDEIDHSTSAMERPPGRPPNRVRRIRRTRVRAVRALKEALAAIPFEGTNFDYSAEYVERILETLKQECAEFLAEKERKIA